VSFARPAGADHNPLLQPWRTRCGLPPFEAIRSKHFEPAFEVAFAEHLAEVDAIGNQAEAPGFENTIAAMLAQRGLGAGG
jgi:peptidyl-dipeptidase Dcp